MKNRLLFLDTETRSDVDLKLCGVHKYSESPHFAPIILAWATTSGPVYIEEIGSGAISPKFMELFNAPDVTIIAHNAGFDRTILKTIGLQVPVNRWFCTASYASYNNCPRSLEGLGKYLSVKQKKLPIGTDLIKLFSKPNRNGEFAAPKDFPTEWDNFKKYAERDVETLRECYFKLSEYQEFDLRSYWADQEVNDRGVRVDIDLAEKATALSDYAVDQLKKQAANLGVANINSVKQVKEFINGMTDWNLTDFTRETLMNCYDRLDTLPASSREIIKPILDIRKYSRKVSTSKYKTMLRTANSDGNIRGMFMYAGASKTGRWTGNLVQLHNLPRGTGVNAEALVGAVRALSNSEDVLRLTPPGAVLDTLSETIRPTFIPSENKRFAVADYANIEARILAWVSGDEKKLGLYTSGKDVYKQTASELFQVPVDSITAEQRQLGKSAELSLGYAVGPKTFYEHNKDSGLDFESLKTIVYSWRKKNPQVVSLWNSVETGFATTIRNPGAIYTLSGGLVKLGSSMTPVFHTYIELPSGRRLIYNNPRLEPKPEWNKEVIVMDSVRPGAAEYTYGGKLVENIAQAISRDILALALTNLVEHKFDVVMHVHDEIVTEVEDSTDLHKLELLMCYPAYWAEPLKLKIDLDIKNRYGK